MVHGIELLLENKKNIHYSDIRGEFKTRPLAERTNNSHEPWKFPKKAHENSWQLKWEEP